MNTEEILVTEEELDELKKKKKLSKIEKKKLRVINRLIAGEINGPKAAQMLKITTRQVRNLKRQVLNEGIEGVVHKNKYNKPVNTYEDEIRQQVTSLYRKQYKGTNFSQYAIILKEEHGLDLSRSTVYNMLRKGRIRSPQRKKKKRAKPKTESTEIAVSPTKKAVKTKEAK
ncbi:MAG TPA: helix-turn-helix domain-containing protein [Bacilli bacterium]|nr:helix-turn-helix domain-containing protein [Bacilli bacterium]